MIFGLLAAAFSAIAYGIASVLQAAAARREPDEGGIDARLLARLLRQGPFIAGFVLDTTGFVAQFVALRYLAVYVVQAVQAGNLAVTALVAVPFLGARLAGREWGAIGAVCVGLVLLATAAGSERVNSVSILVRWGLLIAGLAIVALGGLVGRSTMRFGPVLLGFMAGLGFGIVALAARIITELSFVTLITDPAVYALVIGGVVSFLYYATALQRYAVTTVTAAVIVGETILPAVVGIILLGDAPRRGLVPLAILGFIFAVIGAIMLARFGADPNDPNSSPDSQGATPAKA